MHVGLLPSTVNPSSLFIQDALKIHRVYFLLMHLYISVCCIWFKNNMFDLHDMKT